jgi:hypothetical protein
VAAAAAAGSAFTTSNDFTDPGVVDDAVGYGETTVSGATVSNVLYTPVALDPSKLLSVTFTSTSEIPADNQATMYLKDDATVVATVTGGDCVIGAMGTSPAEQLITCTPGTPVDIEDFNTVALSVMPN